MKTKKKTTFKSRFLDSNDKMDPLLLIILGSLATASVLVVAQFIWNF